MGFNNNKNNNVERPIIRNNNFFDFDGLINSFAEKVGDIIEAKLSKNNSLVLDTEEKELPVSEVTHPLYTAGKYETLAMVWLLEHKALYGKKPSREVRAAYKAYVLTLNCTMNKEELHEHDTNYLNACSNLTSKTPLVNTLGELILE